MGTLNSFDAVDSYSLLFSRLKWPPPYVRLRAAQEIAKLIAGSKTSREAKEAFLLSLSKLELESEAASYLDIIRAFDLKAHFCEQDIRGALPKPSVLSEILIQRLFPTGSASTHWKKIHSGRAPDRFVEPDYFNRSVDGYVVPLVFKSNFERLQKEFGFPFKKQWAYEWTKLMENGRYPYSGTPYYFLGGPSDSKVASLDVRQREVILSAYLKTLSFAADIWRISATLAAHVALDAISLNDGLARIHPADEPSWCAKIREATGLMTQADEFTPVKEYLMQAHDILPASFHIPTFGTENIKRDITVRSFLYEAGSGEADPRQLQNHFESGLALWSARPIEFMGALDFENPERFRKQAPFGVTWPITLATYPMHPARWNQMYFQVGVHLPAAYLTEEAQHVTASANELYVTSGSTKVGHWRTWNKGWTPDHIKDGDPSTGTLTEIAHDVLTRAQKKFSCEVCYIVRCRSWVREREYGNYEHNAAYSLLPIPK